MKWRYIGVLLFFIAAFVGIIGRLFYWQVIQAQALSDMGQQQYGKVVDILPQRGEIKAQDTFPLATSRLSYLVFANPKEVQQKQVVTNVLAPILQEDPASISATLLLDRYWIALASGLTTKDKNTIDALKLPGIGFEESFSRFYPEASMAAQLLGFVGKDELGNPKGYFGIEGFYDRQLKGRPGHAMQIHDAFGRPVLSKIDDSSGEQNGRSLVLHIDRTVQFLVEQKLKESIDIYGADGGTVIVMDPKTGGILAMANWPSFAQSDYSKYSDALYKNPAITNTYEPGSTFKPLVMAAALDANVVKPDSTCPICSGPVQVADYTIETWNKKHFPNETMMDIIKNSDNDGMIYVSQTLGRDRMLSYMNNFGLGSGTGIDLQGEAVPYMPGKSYWHPIDLATASFGQGISLTPIQLLDAFSSIANEGKRMEPHVVSQILTPDGTTIDILPKVLSSPISPQTAKIMTEILVYTVNKGEASFAKVHGYRIAGKTGTASIAVAGHYDPSQTIASFIGFAPADNPKFTMLVILDHPTTSIYGAETAAPVFFGIAKEILTYYGITPTPGVD